MSVKDVLVAHLEKLNAERSQKVQYLSQAAEGIKKLKADYKATAAHVAQLDGAIAAYNDSVRLLTETPESVSNVTVDAIVEETTTAIVEQQ